MDGNFLDEFGLLDRWLTLDYAGVAASLCSLSRPLKEAQELQEQLLDICLKKTNEAELRLSLYVRFSLFRATNVFYSDISNTFRLSIYQRVCKYALETDQSDLLVGRLSSLQSTFKAWDVSADEQREILKLAIALAKGNE